MFSIFFDKVSNFIEDSPRLAHPSQLVVPIFSNFLFLEGRNTVAASFAEITNVSHFPIPVIPTSHVFPCAGELSTRYMANDPSLIFDDVRIEFTQRVYEVLMDSSR